MDDLLQKIKAGSQATKDIPWPGQEDNIIRMRILNDQDYLMATLAADKIITNVTVANVSKYNGEVETQLLYRSVINPETGKNLGAITDFRLILTPEIKVVLVDELGALHDEHSPDPSNMSEEEFDKLFETVKKNAVETVSGVSNIFTLRKLVVSLATSRK